MLNLTAQKRHIVAQTAIERYPQIIKNEMKAFEYLKYLDLQAKTMLQMKQGEHKELFAVTTEWFYYYRRHCYADLFEGIVNQKQIDISKA